MRLSRLSACGQEFASVKNPCVVQLDDMLKVDAAAKWLGISKKELLAKSKGRSAQIPAFRLGRMNIRYNPRTVIAKLAHDAGIKPETVAASMGLAFPGAKKAVASGCHDLGYSLLLEGIAYHWRKAEQ